MRLRWTMVACGCAFLLAGCATPESRIRRNPELFNSFPAEVQEKVRQGQVDVGFTREMVAMALGRPDRIYSRKAESAATEVWAYVSRRYSWEPYPVEGAYLVRDAAGRYRYVPTFTWVDVSKEYEYETLRIEFDKDKAKAVERMQR